MQETLERFCVQATISCEADEMNHCLLTTKKNSPFYHAFDIPSCNVCRDKGLLFSFVYKFGQVVGRHC